MDLCGNNGYQTLPVGQVNQGNQPLVWHKCRHDFESQEFHKKLTPEQFKIQRIRKLVEILQNELVPDCISGRG